MKTYGELREDAATGDYATNASNWNGGQSRKVARRRAKDKKIFHRKERRNKKTSAKNAQSSED